MERRDSLEFWQVLIDECAEELVGKYYEDHQSFSERKAGKFFESKHDYLSEELYIDQEQMMEILKGTNRLHTHNSIYAERQFLRIKLMEYIKEKFMRLAKNTKPRC